MPGSDGEISDSPQGRDGNLAPKRSHPDLRALGIFAAILVAASILTVTFCLLLTPAPTAVFSGWFADDATSTASHEELVHVAVETLDYVNGDASADLPLGDDDTVSYTPEVMSHLDDVEEFFTGVKVACAFCLVALAAVLAVSWLRCRRPGSPIPFRLFASFAMGRGVAVLVIVLAVFVLAALIDFDSLFNFLHSLFFEGGTWTFPADSLLICALPEPFWMSMGVLWAVLAGVVCAVLLACSRLMRRKYVALAVREPM